MTLRSEDEDQSFESRVLELLEAHLEAQRSTSLYVGILAYVTLAAIVLGAIGATVVWALTK